MTAGSTMIRFNPKDLAAEMEANRLVLVVHCADAMQEQGLLGGCEQSVIRRPYARSGSRPNFC